jgi:dipeptidyl aminopeptidase/acylaminoacyl peptidase
MNIHFITLEIKRMLTGLTNLFRCCRGVASIYLLVCVISLIGTGPARADFPALPAAQTLEGGVQFFDVVLDGVAPVPAMRTWIYLPAGNHKDKSLPCVLIAPAGTPLFIGMRLGKDDRIEHLPYVKAGFAVIAYELDGEPAARTDPAYLAAIGQFMAAHGGVDNAHRAVDYALARIPQIDPNRLYAAGHSSAGTVALDVTAADPRIKACCAYAPCPDLRKRLKAALIASVSRTLPQFDAFVDSASPSQHIDALKTKPILLFTAADDDNVPTQNIRDFATDIQHAGGVQVKLVTTESGGHYQSMVEKGIPAGIAFLKACAK